ncbi:MAG TPA: hypothetical protein VLI04_14505, partial [Nocardioidaceae bacterium]|nr:hypothetical protein [Nocardioidaceae bacterium]
SFLPELTDGLKPGGEAAGAPRWESEQVGSGAVLRLGNEDGSLASRVTFEETSKGFRPVRITKCTNDGAGATAPLKLITEGLPGSPDALTPDDFEPGAIPVMDRMTYDVRGLAKRQTLWAGPCGMRICLVAGVKTAFTRGTLKGDSPKPVDDSNQLANPDDAEGQDLGLRLIVVYDRADTLAAVSWDSFDGAINWVDPVAGGGWQGQLFLFMARDADLAVVTLHPNEGEGRNYHRDEFIE